MPQNPDFVLGFTFGVCEIRRELKREKRLSPATVGCAGNGLALRDSLHVCTWSETKSEPLPTRSLLRAACCYADKADATRHI